MSYDGPAWCHSFHELLQAGMHNGKTSRFTLDLTEASAPMWDMHAAHRADPTGIAGAMHIEQLGRVSGRLRLDGREMPVRDAASCRDHSRGARDVTNFRNHCWINGRFPSGRGFNSITSVCTGSKGLPCPSPRSLRTTRIMRPGSSTSKSSTAPKTSADQHRVVLRSGLGEVNIEVREVLATIPLHMTSPFNPAFGVGRGSHGLLFDEAVRLECNGETGFGWSERGFSRHPIR